MDECVLIVFSNQLRGLPADGSLLPISGPDGAENRARLQRALQSVQPAGWTNTLSAMQLAYQHRIDSIILVTNGVPNYENVDRMNKEAAERIFALCREHTDIPVNVVAVGNYFDPEVGAFLRTITQLTGGAFVGR